MTHSLACSTWRFLANASCPESPVNLDWILSVPVFKTIPLALLLPNDKPYRLVAVLPGLKLVRVP